MTEADALARLAGCRDRIDEIDRELLTLLNERARVVEVIGDMKRVMTMPIYEPKREEMVFRNVIDNNAGPLTEPAVRRLFERVIDEMRTLQRERMAAQERAGEKPA